MEPIQGSGKYDHCPRVARLRRVPWAMLFFPFREDSRHLIPVHRHQTDFDLCSAGVPSLRGKVGGRIIGVSASETHPSPTLREERRMGHPCYNSPELTRWLIKR